MKLKYLSLAMMVASGTVLASGYSFGPQSASGLSVSNAGGAEAADASTVYYNPAGITKLKGTNVSAAVELVMPRVKYENASATYYPASSNVAVNGQKGGVISKDLSAVPQVYLTHQINDVSTFGFGVYVPYASFTEYDTDSVLRYNLNQSEVKALALNPNLAWKFNDHAFSVGLIAENMQVKLRQYANFGASLAAFAPALATAGLLGNGKADGYAEAEVEDWGFGFNLAWMWDISDKARVGASYRSSIEHNMVGTAEWTLPTLSNIPSAFVPALKQGLISSGYVPSESAAINIKTPETLSLHGLVKVSDNTNVLADVTWTGHSRFDKAALVYGTTKTVAPQANGNQSNTTYLTPDWNDTYRYSLGVTHQLNQSLQLRGGVFYDESPVPDDTHRLATLPDNDRKGLSFGVNYAINPTSSVDFAYSYLQVNDAKANPDGTCAFNNACVSSQTVGQVEFTGYASIVGLQYNSKF